MLSLDAFEIFVPDKRVSVLELERETALSSENLVIFRLIYGLSTISVWDSDIESLLEHPVNQLTNRHDNLSHIHYLIYVHTASFVAPFGDSYLRKMKEKIHCINAISFEMSMYKCVSYFKVLEILLVLFSVNPNSVALVLTGEVAFTPQLRVVPRSTLVGDAATAALFSSHGSDHRLLSVSNKLIFGYEKGIYLTDEALRAFDQHFIQQMADIILEVISESKLFLNQLALILPHNVNIPTWKKIAATLRCSIEKIYTNNISKFGHCFCSDHLINLYSAISENRIKKGDYYLMAGCGLGFFISAAVFRY